MTDWCDELIEYMQAHHDKDKDANHAKSPKQIVRYHHGLMGFIGYDMSAQELSPNANTHLAQQPCAFFCSL